MPVFGDTICVDPTNSVDIGRSVQDLTQVLLMATQQSTSLTEKLVRMGAENTINENQLSTMGNLVDTYA